MRPTLFAGRWHGVFSFNMDETRANGVNAVAFANEFTRLATVHGITMVEAPVVAGRRQQNPATDRNDLGWGLGRVVWTLNAWFSCATAINGGIINDVAANALRNSGAGSDVDAARVARGLDTCSNLHEWYEGAIVSPQFATVCATFEAYGAGSPPPAPGTIQGVLARAAAQPTSDSNNADNIGRELPVFTTPGGTDVTMTTLKTAGVVVGVLASVAILAYFLNSVARVKVAVSS